MNNNNWYNERELIKPTFLQKTFKINNKENFIIELENLLYKKQNDILSLTTEEVGALKSKYKVGNSEFETERKELYEIYLNKCLNDEFLSEEEKNGLDHLRILLDVSEEYARQRMKSETEHIYRRKVQCVVADGKIDENESKELDEMKKNLDIDYVVARDAQNSEVSKIIQPYVDELIAKRRMSPEEEEKLYQMAKDLNTTLSFDGDGLERIKLLWQIENAELPGIESDINLQKSEKLYYAAPISWYEERSRTTRVNYGGVSARYRVCKGVYLTAGSIAPSRHTEEYLKFIDEGFVYITSKRIIFRGEHGNKTIPLTNVLSYTPYNNGIEIEKASGKSPCFKCDDSELMGMYISRAINDL